MVVLARAPFRATLPSVARDLRAGVFCSSLQFGRAPSFFSVNLFSALNQTLPLQDQRLHEHRGLRTGSHTGWHLANLTLTIVKLVFPNLTMQEFEEHHRGHVTRAH